MTTKAIWKYRPLLIDSQAILMPEGAKILCVQMQGGNLSLWALVDPKAKKEDRMIVIYGTGHPVGEAHPSCKLKHIGTVQMDGGSLVWHVFEVI